MHSHILPGIDADAKIKDESLSMLHTAVNEAITNMILAPHFYPSRHAAAPEEVIRLLR